MFDTNEVAQRPRGRAEILGGVVRRRRWSDEEKGRIVAEAITPGAVISRIARRHEMTPQHLSNWIKAAKAGLLALPGEEGMAFVPVVAEQGGKPPAAVSAIEIVIGAVLVRVPFGADAHMVETVLSVLARR